MPGGSGKRGITRWTLDKLLKGAGPGADPAEIDLPADGGNLIIWKDASENALALSNQIAPIAWTDLDLTAFVSADAFIAVVLILFKVDKVGTFGTGMFEVRKNGTTPSVYPTLRYALGEVDGTYKYMACLIGMDSGHVIEYKLSVANGGQYDCFIHVLGYIE